MYMYILLAIFHRGLFSVFTISAQCLYCIVIYCTVLSIVHVHVHVLQLRLAVCKYMYNMYSTVTHIINAVLVLIFVPYSTVPALYYIVLYWLCIVLQLPLEVCKYMYCTVTHIINTVLVLIFVPYSTIQYLLSTCSVLYCIVLYCTVLRTVLQLVLYCETYIYLST